MRREERRKKKEERRKKKEERRKKKEERRKKTEDRQPLDKSTRNENENLLVPPPSRSTS
jgi:hypothetical protein